MTLSSAPACAAPDLTRNCCARDSTWQSANWDLPARMSVMNSTPSCSSRRGPIRRSSVWDLIDDELKFPRARMERNVRDHGHLERDVAKSLLRQDFRKPRSDSGNGGDALRIIERGLNANRKAKRSGTGDLHLKARHAF